jgi:hypothetical protein
MSREEFNQVGDGMQKWEYTSTALITEQKRTGKTSDVEILNKYGSDGWELVCVTPLHLGRGFDFIAYFKRQKE